MENNIISNDEINFVMIEKELGTEPINVDTYLDYFFKINTAASKGTIKNPIRLYLALRNANVIVNVNGKEIDNKISVYNNVINTVNYLISYYAKEYISSDYNFDDYISSINNILERDGFISFHNFKDAYYLFELYVLAEINENELFNFINLLNEVYVETESINEIIDLSNMKEKLSSYIENYKNNKKYVK